MKRLRNDAVKGEFQNHKESLKEEILKEFDACDVVAQNTLAPHPERIKMEQLRNAAVKGEFQNYKESLKEGILKEFDACEIVAITDKKEVKPTATLSHLTDIIIAFQNGKEIVYKVDILAQNTFNTLATYPERFNSVTELIKPLMDKEAARIVAEEKALEEHRIAMQKQAEEAALKVS